MHREIAILEPRFKFLSDENNFLAVNMPSIGKSNATLCLILANYCRSINILLDNLTMAA